jgi:hypothetical protein
MKSLYPLRTQTETAVNTVAERYKIEQLNALGISFGPPSPEFRSLFFGQQFGPPNIILDPRHDALDGHCYDGCPCLTEDPETCPPSLRRLVEPSVLYMDCDGTMRSGHDYGKDTIIELTPAAPAFTGIMVALLIESAFAIVALATYWVWRLAR